MGISFPIEIIWYCYKYEFSTMRISWDPNYCFSQVLFNSQQPVHELSFRTEEVNGLAIASAG